MPPGRRKVVGYGRPAPEEPVPSPAGGAAVTEAIVKSAASRKPERILWSTG